MPRYALFLRALNVGGRRVTMNVLKEILEDAGCSRVETLIASGNVAVDSKLPEAKLVPRLERALGDGLGFDVPLFARAGDELATLAASIAGRPADDATLYVAFLAAPLSRSDGRRVAAASTPTESLEPRGREVLWTCRTTFHESVFAGPALEKLLGAPTTVRKSTTVARMAAKLAGA